MASEFRRPGPRSALRRTLATLALTAAYATSVFGEGAPSAESRLAGRAAPDIPLRLADGRTMRLSELADGKPLLITFFYRRCTGVCTPLLAWVRDAVRKAGGLGVDYRVLALSFDDADTIDDLRAQARVTRVLDSPHWSFAVTEQEALAQITGALDFWYRPDPATGQIDHPALVAALDQGRVVRTMLGAPDVSERLQGLLAELRGAFIPYYRLPHQTPFACVSFDSSTGETRLHWGLMLLVLPALTAAVAAYVLFFLGAKRRRMVEAQNGRTGASPVWSCAAS
ncbi:MAG TPA: SCO family protein [Steroidobacter sp.]|nr:SCO family protein [Steroidobacteraceae bacterium]HLS81745.1 SCO family protein [Steroidobacter sp.]